MTSYKELIDDHDEIAAQARMLLDEIAHTQRTDISAVATRMMMLTDLVTRHVEKETALLLTIGGRAASLSWGQDWTSVAASFEAVRDRWEHFLAKWDAATIATNWPLFRLEARSIFRRLNAQVMEETRLFYSTAMREGAISLR